jgi:hypothetical protein
LKKPISLIVRPHPREAGDAFGGLRADGVRVSVSREENGADVAMSSDLVVGMTSMLLVEALQLGCRVVSLQPGRRGPEVFPPDIAARLRIATGERDIEPALAECLQASDREFAMPVSAPADATGRVLEEIYAMVFDQVSQDGI